MELEQNVNTSSYLSFKLGDEIFAANVNKVLNILELVRITQVPQSPPYIKGVINLRGDVLPVVDTRIKFSLPPTKITKHTCILVMDINLDGEELKIGALVDGVLEVMEIEDENLQPSPTIGDKYKTEFIKSMAEFNDQFIMILDVDKVFTSDEIVDLKNSTNTDDFGEANNLDLDEKKDLTEKTLPKDIAPKEITPKDTVPKDTVSKDTVSKDTVSKDTVSKDTVPKDTVPKKTVPKDTATKKTVPKETVSKRK